jgi:hypothetical protein
MLLRVFDPPECSKPRVVAEDPSPAIIASTVLGLEWSDITFVELWVDDDHLMCGSGSLQYGLAMSWFVDGKHLVSDRPLVSLEEMVSLLQSYRAGDSRWREVIGWG